jgi:hypothetical protein
MDLRIRLVDGAISPSRFFNRARYRARARPRSLKVAGEKEAERRARFGEASGVQDSNYRLVSPLITDPMIAPAPADSALSPGLPR